MLEGREPVALLLQAAVCALCQAFGEFLQVVGGLVHAVDEVLCGCCRCFDTGVRHAVQHGVIALVAYAGDDGSGNWAQAAASR